jgi:hypothetical protein
MEAIHSYRDKEVNNLVDRKMFSPEAGKNEVILQFKINRWPSVTLRCKETCNKSDIQEEFYFLTVKKIFAADA